MSTATEGTWSSPSSRVPHACYRVQLHQGFTFHDAADLADYLRDLGVSHLYCSPYLQAVPGSTHGYDVVDPGRLSDDLGGDAGFATLVAALGAAGLGQVLDIVPNHMAASPTANRWWWDVLENGAASRYATYFDIDWQGPEEKATGTVLAPILGDHYGRALEAGQITVARDERGFTVRYADHALPVSPRTLDGLLERSAARADDADLAELGRAFGNLPHARRHDPEAVRARHQQKEQLQEQLTALIEARPEVVAAIDAELTALNRDVAALDELLERQNYRLAYWRAASEELDFRRFFNIETLVGLRMEDHRVFQDTHALVLDLVRTGTVDGLRIDHVDGLRDPQGYLDRLHEATGAAYTVVEKILEGDEELRPSWPVAGTTGYEFLNRVNGVFVAADGEAGLTDLYQRFTGQTARYEDVVHAAKHQIMSRELAAEVERLVRLLADICQAHRRHRDHTRRDLRTAMREVLAAFPVYRTYVRVGQPVTEEDRACVLVALRDARERRPELDAELLEFIGELLLLEHDGAAELELALRFQQVSSPVMAKGIEDTAFYRYHRLVSLNEVGGDPGGFGRSVDSFHEVMQTATTSWPDAMVTLSTHDTKRSSDVRARIDLLSELPGAWAAAVDRWATGNEQHRRDGWPDRNIEYLLYQTLVGAWPIGADRVVAFVNKAAREAKVHTSWTSPDPGYDSGLESFVRAVLADRDFTDDVERFLTDQRIVELGRVGSLAQTALHLTCPGVPDIYQGTEVWDLSLVDPDNRRAVDYDQRRRLLRRLLAGGLDDALATPDEGGPKLWLVHRLLHHRARRPERYRDGSYLPLATSGARSRHALAFHRDGLVVVVPRLVAGNWFEPEPWADTSVDIPAGRWNDVLTDDRCEGGTIPVAELLRRFPVAVLDRDDG